MTRPITVNLDGRHLEALHLLSAKMDMGTEEVMRHSLRVLHSLWLHKAPMPVDGYADLPALPSQEQAVVAGETTPFSSVDDYLRFHNERVFGFIKVHIEPIDPAARQWTPVVQDLSLGPVFRQQLAPRWLQLPISMDRRLTILNDRLVERGVRSGFAQLMRPYTDPRVLPWVSECGETIVKFVEAYICGFLPGQTSRMPDTAMADMIRELWAKALQPLPTE